MRAWSIVGAVVVVGAAIAGAAHADPGDRVVVTGKVIDANGKPVAGAEVSANFDFYDPASHGVADHFPESGIVVAADGTFVIRDGILPAGAKALRYRTTASAPGYSRSDEVVSVPVAAAGGARVVLKLRPAVEHVVTVIDADTQTPIAGAIVNAMCPRADLPLLVGVDGVLRLRACDDRNETSITASAAGYQPGGVNVDFAKPAQTIKLSKWRPLRMHVVDDATGAAIANCDITIDRTTGRTDAQGDINQIAVYGWVYPTPGCPGYGINMAGSYHLMFSAADATAIHELKLRHNLAFDGTVVDHDHRPVASATVEVRQVNEISRARQIAVARMVTGADGHFHFDSFSADQFALSAQLGDQFASQTITATAIGAAPIVLVLARTK